MLKVTRTHLGAAVTLPSSESMPFRQLFGIGQNYAKHAKEMGGAPPERPVVFAKNIACLIPSGEAIRVPAICQDREQVDYEGELAVIIGPAPARDVSKERALEYVLGFAAANDVSARWWQKQGSGGQFCRGKGFDTFCPISDITPTEKVGDPSQLRLITRLNGQVMQDSETSDMIFDVPTLVSELSRGTTLLPGTVILTGTPSGVGTARTPPVYLKHGDVVEIEISKVGLLRSPVVFES